MNLPPGALLFRSDEVSGWIYSEESSKTNQYLYCEEATVKATGVVIAQSAYQGYFSSSFSDYKVVYGKCENFNLFSLFCQPALLHVMT